MSQQYDGGLITATPVAPSGPYQNSTAPGIWTLDQQLAYAKQGIWPTAGNLPKDAQFNYVTMLLHGDGTNGTQNNTFLDSGPNSLTMTRVNTPTQGSFSPYGSTWSNAFNIASYTNYFSIASNAAFGMGTGDYTIECWFYCTDTGGYQPIIDCRDSSPATGQILFRVYATGQFYFSIQGTGTVLTSPANIATNTWVHAAVVKASGVYTLYINGTSVATATNSVSIPTSPVNIGYDQQNGNKFVGYISNLRIVKGTAVYTGNFTPSTTPLTAVSGTSLLTCQSNRFVDNSSNNFTLTITKTGTTDDTISVQRFNPFGTSTSYSTSSISGSTYFNQSTTDAITFPGSSEFTLGTNDFTIECWVYINDSSSRKYIYAPGNDTASHLGGFGLEIWGQQLCMWASSTGSSWNMLECDTAGNRGNITIPVNAWTHVAAVRTGGNTFKSYVNGVLDRTFTNSGSIYNNTSQILNIGRTTYTGGYAYFNGYISNFRVVNGTAVYTSSFTPPTSPLTAITNTKVLTLSTNAGIYDNAMMNDFITVGNAQISTSVKKYGTGSLYFDGTGDWLIAPDNPSLEFGSGNFTLECWINTTVSNSGYVSAVAKWGTSNQSWMIRAASTDIGSGWSFFYSTDGSSYATVFGSSINDGNWHHIAVTRSGNVFRTFTDGTLNNSATASVTLFDGTLPVYVGAQSGGGNPFTGYIDDLRITKGYARYTANFTPPTEAFLDRGPN